MSRKHSQGITFSVTIQGIPHKLNRHAFLIVCPRLPISGWKKMEALMKLPRSRMITKIIVFALIIYAVISLIAIRGNIESAREDLGEVRRAVTELEITNAELEYEIENHNEPDVIADIARSNLGLVLPGEIVFFDGGSDQEPDD